MPHALDGRTDFGCPYDCGLCPDHEQHSCLALIEINDHCNLSCPVCFAESGPHRPEHKSLAEIERLMDRLVAAEGEPDLLQISGGEPTLHPDFHAIIRAARARPIRHVMVNTNGVRIARDPDFAASLAEFKQGFEVYLQFDSLKPAALKHLRGADLTRVRAEALAALEKHGISTTLVCTVKRGVNDDEIGAIIDHALQFECVRGVTLQPVQDAGRNEGFDKNDRTVLTDIRRAIYEQSPHFAPEDLVPLPCHPENICIGYGLRVGHRVTPVTGLIPREQLVSATPNTVSFERYPDLRERLFSLLSLSTVGEATGGPLHQLLCCLPAIEPVAGLDYRNIFRVVIVQFMDRFNFDLGSVKRSCIHFVDDRYGLVPFDTYNLFYRNGKIDGIRKRLRVREQA